MHQDSLGFASSGSIWAPFWINFNQFWLYLASILPPFSCSWIESRGETDFKRILSPVRLPFGSLWVPFWLPFGATFATFWRSGSASIYGPPLLMFSVPYWAPFWYHFGVDFRCQSGVKINQKNNRFWDAILKDFRSRNVSKIHIKTY